MKDEERSRLDRRYTNPNVSEATEEYKRRCSGRGGWRYGYHYCLPSKERRINSRASGARASGFNRYRPYNCSPYLCYRCSAPRARTQFWQRSCPSGLGMIVAKIAYELLELNIGNISKVSSCMAGID